MHTFGVTMWTFEWNSVSAHSLDSQSHLKTVWWTNLLISIYYRDCCSSIWHTTRCTERINGNQFKWSVASNGISICSRCAVSFIIVSIALISVNPCSILISSFDVCSTKPIQSATQIVINVSTGAWKSRIWLMRVWIVWNEMIRMHTPNEEKW